MSPSESPSAERSLRGFWSLFVTQFQGAFSDNVLKNLVIFMMIGLGLSLSEKHRIGELVGALFSLPFILFSMAGGFLADRFSKRTITVGVKVFEIGVMLLACAGLMREQMPVLLACVFLMGMHSAVFGPSKYGLLPELLPERRLSWGNGLLELGTFTAIILGTVAAAFLASRFHGHQSVSGLLLVALAALGLGISLGITRVPAADPSRKFRANFVGEVVASLRAMRGDRPLVLAVIGNAYFTFLGALLLLNLFFYGDGVLHASEEQIGFLTASLALGIGLGSIAAGYLSGGKIEYGLVPLGAIGLSVFSAALAAPGLTMNAALVRLALLGFSGGFFIVPISALLQHRPDKAKKGSVLAAANLLSFVGVFLASGAHYVLAQRLQLSPLRIFFFGGALTLAGAVYALVLLPDALLRFVLWVLTRTVYRIHVLGRDNIPEKGGALFVCNHVSFVDALLLLASTDRQVRFMMFKGIYERPHVKPFARILGVIPISSEQRPREMIHALQSAGDAIRAGDVVCIFAEGQITRIGQLLPFRRGFERIMKNVDAPIIPVGLDGVWGSIFSYHKGRFFWKVPRRLPYPVTVNYGAPMPRASTPFEVRQAVQELLADAWRVRKARMVPLQRGFIRTARVHPFRFAMADARNPRVRFGSALVRTVFLARRLKRVWAGQGCVGLLLPPSVPGALTNFAAMLAGKIPVNLNYTASDDALASCIRQCGIRTVISSRAFLEKVKCKPSCDTVFLEDLMADVAAGGGVSLRVEKAVAWVMAVLWPAGRIERALRDGTPGPAGLAGPAGAAAAGRDPVDELATVIFSSGSTGDPKGVLLTHSNVGSNIEQLEQVFGLSGRDCILGLLPFFHSFGFTGTLCLPAVLGVGVAYHPNPLDAKAIGPLIRQYQATFLLATPTFLQFYMRACAAEDLGSLRLVMTGAEKLPERLAAAFEDKFGIRPLEGYGCTECSPVVAVNTRDYRAAGFRQVGGKRGKIGHPLPGVSIRVVDPDTREPVPQGRPGLMLVRGPNVMQGYLGLPDKTAEALVEGAPPDPGKWYVTGDIAAIDEDGFLQITDRLSRFSKIGGEMVPHIKAEEKLHELAGLTEQSFVVAGVPDERKGERLVVLHRLGAEPLKACLEKLAQSDLPNLWKPRPEDFYFVEAFPLLGTGKLDLRKVRELALSKSSERG